MSFLASSPSGMRIAAAVGLSGSAWCSGAILSISLVSINAMLDPNLPPSATSSAACLWENIYDRGKKTMPPLAITSALGYAYVAYSLRAPPFSLVEQFRNKQILLVLAAVLTASIAPWTLLTMVKTNSALQAKATMVRVRKDKDAAVVLDDGTRELLKKWNWLNIGRGLLPLAGAAVGTWALLF